LFLNEVGDLSCRFATRYLHGPDRKTDYAVTLKTVDELYRKGKFKRFGISNYAA
jgi:aryl-alcohol dehydrogenase-like predicted oxidoreductase